MDQLGVLDHPAEKLGSAMAHAVLEGRGDVEHGLALSHVIFARGEGVLSRSVAILSERVGNVRDLEIQRLKGKVLAGGETAAERYEPRSFQVGGSTLERTGLAGLGFGTETICRQQSQP